MPRHRRPTPQPIPRFDEMKLIAVASVLLFAGVAVCEEPTVQLNDFQSKAAKLAVKTFNERLSFLEQSMQQHVDTANAKLREELKAALEQAAKQEDLKIGRAHV